MKDTTMNLQWGQSRLINFAVCAAAPRPTVRDSLWVSLMAARRSLDSALEDRLMGFPRRPAASHASQATAPSRARPDASVDRGQAEWNAEELVFLVISLSALASLISCFWQMCLSVG